MAAFHTLLAMPARYAFFAAHILLSRDTLRLLRRRAICAYALITDAAQPLMLPYAIRRHKMPLTLRCHAPIFSSPCLLICCYFIDTPLLMSHVIRLPRRCLSLSFSLLLIRPHAGDADVSATYAALLLTPLPCCCRCLVTLLLLFCCHTPYYADGAMPRER